MLTVAKTIGVRRKPVTTLSPPAGDHRVTCEHLVTTRKAVSETHGATARDALKTLLPIICTDTHFCSEAGVQTRPNHRHRTCLTAQSGENPRQSFVFQTHSEQFFRLLEIMNPVMGSGGEVEHLSKTQGNHESRSSARVTAKPK